jgi:hypothetical protein
MPDATDQLCHHQGHEGGLPARGGQSIVDISAINTSRISTTRHVASKPVQVGSPSCGCAAGSTCEHGVDQQYGKQNGAMITFNHQYGDLNVVSCIWLSYLEKQKHSKI